MDRLLPLSALFGGLFLAFAPFLAMRIPSGYTVGVGVIAAICGAPFFLFHLASRQNGESRDI